MTQELYTSLVELLGEPQEAIQVSDDDIVGYWTPVIDRTLNDCVYGNRRGCFDHVCINRISANLEYIHIKMAENDIRVAEMYKTHLYLRTDYFKADEYNRFVDLFLEVAELSNIDDNLPRKIPELTALLYTDINDLESITFAARIYSETISSSVLQSGEVFSGEW